MTHKQRKQQPPRPSKPEIEVTPAHARESVGESYIDILRNAPPIDRWEEMIASPPSECPQSPATE